jgi:hypothetical protein
MGTVIDFGCTAAPALARFIASWPSAFAFCAVALGLLQLGWATRRLTQTSGADIKAPQAMDALAGWAIFTIFMTVVATTRLVPLWPVAAAAAMAVAVVLVWRIVERLPPSALEIFVLAVGVPLFATASASGVAEWDDFSHWVPNAAHLYTFDALPSLDQPSLHSQWPGYPYAMGFVTHATSLLAGGFVVQGGAMHSLFLLMIAGSVLVSLLTQGTAFPASPLTLPQLAIGLLAATLLNPSFTASFNVTGWADTATTLVVLATALVLPNGLEARGSHNLSGQGLGFQRLVLPALLCTLLVLIKQANVVLLALLLTGSLSAGWWRGELRQTARDLALIVIAPLAARALWGAYVVAQIGGNGFSFRPLAEWRPDLAGALMWEMLIILVKHPPMFLMFGATLACAVLTIRRQRRDPLGGLTLIAALAFCGYQAFLIAAYLGAFFPEETVRAASYFRYSSHLSLLSFAVLLLWAAEDWPRWRIKLSENWPAIAAIDVKTGSPALAASGLAAMGVIAAVLALAPRTLVPQPTPGLCLVRQAARQVVAGLLTGSELLVVSPSGNTLAFAITNHELVLERTRSGRISRAAFALSPEGAMTADSHYSSIFSVDPEISHRPRLVRALDRSSCPMITGGHRPYDLLVGHAEL